MANRMTDGRHCTHKRDRGKDEDDTSNNRFRECATVKRVVVLDSV